MNDHEVYIARLFMLFGLVCGIGIGACFVVLIVLVHSLLA